MLKKTNYDREKALPFLSQAYILCMQEEYYEKFYMTSPHHDAVWSKIFRTW